MPQKEPNLPAPIDYGICEHPRSRAVGVCERSAVGVFEIPDDYDPPHRHANQPNIPRPKARLCRQHRGMVEAYLLNEDIPGNSHRANCDACRHPDVEWANEQYVNWRNTVTEICAVLGIRIKSWYKHVNALGLDQRRMSRAGREKVLSEIIEKGMRGPGHSVRTALDAVKELRKEVGDGPAEKHEHDHNIKAFIGTLDLTSMSPIELANHLDELSATLRRAEEEAARQRALDAGSDSTDRVIDLPKSAVTVRSEK